MTITLLLLTSTLDVLKDLHREEIQPAIMIVEATKGFLDALHPHKDNLTRQQDLDEVIEL
jgi:hypothetical protein